MWHNTGKTDWSICQIFIFLKQIYELMMEGFGKLLIIQQLLRFFVTLEGFKKYSEDTQRY